MASLGRWEQLIESIDELLQPVSPSPRLQRLKVWVTWQTVGAEAALSELDKVEAQGPEDNYLRAQLLAALDRMDDAVAQIDRALALDPNSADLASTKSQLLWRAGSADASMAVLGDALTRIPDNWRLWALRAEQLRVLGRFEEALRDIDHALELQENASNHGTRGQILAALNRREKAAIAFDRGAELDARLGWLQSERGENLNQLGRLVDALAALDAAVALEPGSVYAHGTRGQVLRQLGRDSEALASLQRADQLAQANNRPTPAWVLEELAATLFNFDEYQKAFEVLSRAEGDLSFFGQIMRADLLTALGRVDEALDETERLLAEQPEARVSLLMSKAQALTALGRLTPALDVINKALEMEPHDPQATGVLVLVLMALERYHDALAALEADVLPSLPDNDWVLAAKGSLLVGLGRYQEAKDFLEAATQGSERPLCLVQLASARFSLGDPDAAVGAYEKALRGPREARELWWLTELGDARCQQARAVTSEALQAFEQGAELAAERPGGGPDVLAEGGWCLFRLGRSSEAIENYTTAIRMSELCPWARIELASVLLAAGRANEAAATLDRALTSIKCLHDGDRRAALLADGRRLLDLLRDDGTLQSIDPRDVDLLAQRLRGGLMTEPGAG